MSGDILEEFEIAMDGNVTFHQSLIFPASRWVRSVRIDFAEGEHCVLFDIKAELLHTFGISCTDIIENSFNWLQEKARRDKAEKQAPITQWQRTMASSFMEAHDRRPLQLSAESDTLAPQTVSQDIFKASKCKYRWREKLLSRLLEHWEGDAWPHPSPLASLWIPEAWYLPRPFRCYWGTLQHAWRSLPGKAGPSTEECFGEDSSSDKEERLLQSLRNMGRERALRSLEKLRERPGLPARLVEGFAELVQRCPFELYRRISNVHQFFQATDALTLD